MELSENGRKARCEAVERKIYADRRRPGGGPQARKKTPVEEQVAEPAKPSMREAFGPDGFLEKCMRGRGLTGRSHPTTSTGWHNWRWRSWCNDAFENAPTNAIVEAGTGNREDAGIPNCRRFAAGGAW